LELGKTIKELHEQISTVELLHWWRYYNEYPFGYYRSDLREALNCAVTAAPHSRKSHPLQSFLLFREPEPEPTTEELTSKLHAIFGGAING